MRLRKGDRVEVLSQKEVSSGSWSCAEIISGNGRSYSVRFLSSVEAVERVPRRAIRPCPPPVAGSNVWAAGDLAEAFHNSSWKQAKIMKIVSVHCYIVRLLGSPLDVLVGQSNLRMRQAWHDGRWFLLGKAIGGSGSLSRNKQTKTNMVKSKDQQLVVTFPGRRKRPLPSQSISHNLSVQTKKVTEKDVRCLPSSWIKDDMNLTQELNTIRLSSTFRTENVEVTTGSAGLREGNLIPVTSTHSQADSCASSVGSNRSTDEFFKDPFVSVARCSKDVEDVDCHSDAESATGRGHGEEDSCSYKEVLARFHSLWHFS